MSFFLDFQCSVGQNPPSVILQSCGPANLRHIGAVSQKAGWVRFSLLFSLQNIACGELFMLCIKNSSRAHAAAPPFQTEPAVAGLRFGAALRAAVFHLD